MRPSLYAVLLLPAFASTAAWAGDFDDMTLNGNAGLVEPPGEAAFLRLVPALQAQVGSAFKNAPFTIDATASFSTAFSFLIDGGSQADGLTFVVQGNGPTAIGESGGYLGYHNLRNSVAVAFDTYDNGWDSDPGGENIAILTNGDATTGPSALIDTLPGLRSEVRYAWIEFSGATQTLEVFYSDSATKPVDPLLSHNLGGALSSFTGGTVYAGFTAATGGSTDNHDILSWQFSATPPIPEPETYVLMALGLAGVAATVRRKQGSARYGSTQS